MQLELNCTAITDNGLKQIRPASIVELGLSGTGVTSAGLSHLTRFPKLRWVRMDAALLDDVGIKNLVRCKKLKSITIQGSLCDAVRQKLHAHIPNLTIQEFPVATIDKADHKSSKNP